MTIMPLANPDMCAGANSADVNTDADIGAGRGRCNGNRQNTRDREAQRQQHFPCLGHLVLSVGAVSLPYGRPGQQPSTARLLVKPEQQHAGSRLRRLLSRVWSKLLMHG